MVRTLGISLRSFETFVTALVALIAMPTCLVFAQLPDGDNSGRRERFQRRRNPRR